MKKTITQSERLQLLGLLTLARSHRVTVDKCEDEMNKIVEVENYSHLTDAIYDENDFDQVLKKMEIEVTDD